MIEIERILCPTDFSEFSDWALTLALPLARWYRSEISVMHVVPRVLMHPEYFPYMQEPVLPSPDVRKQALGELDRFVEKARESGIGTEVFLEEGDSVEEVLRKADRLPADLIIMGTHGRRGFERLVLGSVAEKVLRKSPCPVLTVSSRPERIGEEVFFKKIVCPVDFGTASVKALEFALSLAQEAEAQLTLLHVVESMFDHSSEKKTIRSTKDLRRRLEEEALERLTKAVPEQALDWCRCEEVVTYGRPYQQILKWGEANDVDLIVMGVHGRGAVDLMIFGSTTHQVVRQAPCPVLTIRSG
jgi:nucleotide-binding universal stress UspA family protein